MKLHILKVATVSEFVQFGFQPISHFLLFLPGKERIISGTKLYNVRAVGFDLLPLPGTVEVSYGEKKHTYITHYHPWIISILATVKYLAKTIVETQRFSAYAPVRSPLVFKSVELHTIVTWEGGSTGLR